MAELLIALQQMAIEIAEAEGVDPALFSRLVMQESSWNPTAGVDEGQPFPSYVGLGQLNETFGGYFISLHGKGVVKFHRLANSRFGRYWTDARIRATLLDPRINLTIAAREMRRLVEYFDDWQTALAAWNWGPGNVLQLRAERPQDWMAHLPEETSWMIAKVLLPNALERYGMR